MSELWWGTHTEMFGPRNAHRVGLMLHELRKVPPRARILEAAVGLGDLASRLEAAGHRVVGVDRSVEAVQIARTKTRGLLLIADLTALPFREGTFDAITSGETLEHVPDDRGAVQELSRVLRRGGIAIVTVPALEALRTFSDTYYEHLRRYSRPQLVELFAAAGLSRRFAAYWGFPFVLAYDYLFMLPLNYRRARRAVREDTGLQAVASLGKRQWLVQVVRWLFGIDRWFRWIPLGVGLVLTAEKR